MDWEGYSPKERSWSPCCYILDQNLLYWEHLEKPGRMPGGAREMGVGGGRCIVRVLLWTWFLCVVFPFLSTRYLPGTGTVVNPHQMDYLRLQHLPYGVLSVSPSGR